VLEAEAGISTGDMRYIGSGDDALMRPAPRASVTGLTLLSLLVLTGCGKHY
jgi:hypothetical protein